MRPIFLAINDFLDVGRTPEPVDCIFVFAGRPERKVYALELFQQGYAPCITFSVGRFEWRRFAQLGLKDDGGLLGLVQQTPAPRRHFFIFLDDHGAQCFLIPQGKFGTLSEARALSKVVQAQNIASLIVVSSGFHLRRAVAALRRCGLPKKLRIVPVAVPEKFTRNAPENLWTKSEISSIVIKEYVKYIFYKLLPPYCFRLHR